MAARHRTIIPAVRHNIQIPAGRTVLLSAACRITAPARLIRTITQTPSARNHADRQRIPVSLFQIRTAVSLLRNLTAADPLRNLTAADPLRNLTAASLLRKQPAANMKVVKDRHTAAIRCFSISMK